MLPGEGFDDGNSIVLLSISSSRLSTVAAIASRMLGYRVVNVRKSVEKKHGVMFRNGESINTTIWLRQSWMLS